MSTPIIWRDRDGSVWKELPTGLLQFNQGTPKPFKYVDEEWGPLVKSTRLDGLPDATKVEDAPILAAEDTPTKESRKAVRRAVKELYDGAYGLSTEYSGAGAIAMAKDANDALQVLNDLLGLNIKLKED